MEGIFIWRFTGYFERQLGLKSSAGNTDALGDSLVSLTPQHGPASWLVTGSLTAAALGPPR